MTSMTSTDNNINKLMFPHIEENPFILLMSLNEAKNAVQHVLRGELDSFEESWKLTTKQTRKNHAILLFKNMGAHYICETFNRFQVRSQLGSCRYMNPSTRDIVSSMSPELILRDRRYKKWEGYFLFEARCTDEMVISRGTEAVQFHIKTCVENTMKKAGKGKDTWAKKADVEKQTQFNIPAYLEDDFPAVDGYTTLKRIRDAEQRLERELCKIVDNYNRMDDHTSLQPTVGPTQQTRDDEQKRIVEVFAEQPVSILIGPAGSGKSTVIGDICARFESVVVAAPTNMAVERMKSIFRKNPDITCDAFTLHRMYYNKQVHAANSSINTLIVDECSMVDYEILGMAISRYHFKRILFVGDNAQLPPVSSGWFFHDIIKDDRYEYPRVELTGNYRSNAPNIIGNSRKIRDWDNEDNDHTLVCYPGEWEMVPMCKCARHESSHEVLTKFSEQIRTEVSRRNWAVNDTMVVCHMNAVNMYVNLKLQEHFQPQQNHSVQCLGKEESFQLKNKKWEKRAKTGPQRWAFRTGDRVVLLKNVNRVLCFFETQENKERAESFVAAHPTVSLEEEFTYMEDKDVPPDLLTYYSEHVSTSSSFRTFLTQIGYTCCNDPVCGKAALGNVEAVTEKTVKVRFNNGEVLVMSNDSDLYKHTLKKDLHTDNLCLAYSVTVHKAQGNEWNNVLFHHPEGWVGRNLVYTATTRGQESVCVITPQDRGGGWPEMIEAAKTPEKKRYTRLFR